MPLALAVAAVPALCAVAQEAAGPERAAMRVAAFFWHDAPNDEAAFTGIERGLRAAGFECIWTVRRAGSDRERARQQLLEIAAARPRILFTLGTQATLLAKEHVKDVPIVFTAVTHPVESGVAESWQSAGGNVCGNSNWIGSEKVIDAFRLAVPRLRHLGMIRSTASGEVSAAELRQMRRYLAEPAAPRIELVERVVERAADLPAAANDLRARGVEAIWVPIDHLVYQNIQVLLDAVRGSGVPLVSSAQRGAEAGAAVGVLVDYALLGERAAAMARLLLLGKATPAALPVGTMQSSHVVVNLAAAKACAYDLPLAALVVADRILDHVEDPPR
jgi:putative ABC transport system substrate-binding protein